MNIGNRFYRKKSFWLAAVIACASPAFALPINAVYNYGWEHFKPAWDHQLYNIVSFFETVRPDVVVMYKCDWATAGNILTLENQLNEGDSTGRVDIGFSIISVSFEGGTEVIPTSASAASILGAHGSITFFRNGFYVYTSFESSPLGHHDEEFTIEAITPSGDKQVFNLEVDVYVTEKTANKWADYNNQISGQNAIWNGASAYQTVLTGGSMIFGWTGEDTLVGNGNSNAIFGWSGEDSLYGLSGSDFLQGEQGNNRLVGGSGGDFFEMHSTHGKNGDGEIVDVIVDFSPTQGDVVSLMNVVNVNRHPDAQLLSDSIRTNVTEGFMDILVSPDQNGLNFTRVVRLLKNSAFDPLNTSLTDLYQRGNIQF